MQVGLSSFTYDLEGAFILDIIPEKSDLENYERRISREATIDGNVAVTDGGFSHGDRTITLVCQPEEETAARLRTFFQNYSHAALTLPDGCFDAYLQYFHNDFGMVTMTLLIKEEI